MATTPLREDWRLTRHLSYFQHHGRVYAYHDQIGYLLAMSPDVVSLLEFHRDQSRTPFEVDARFGRHFGRTQLGEFLSILESHRLLVDPALDEDEIVWRMVPVKARWVVFHQPDPDTLTFWQARRGAEPEFEQVPGWAARLWGLIDGEQTLEALFEALSEAPGLVGEGEARRIFRDTVMGWVHHSRQVLRLSKVPLRRYRGRVPPYIRSEMPFAPWVPGQALPSDPLEALAAPIAPPTTYYEAEVEDAEVQFDDVETTLSHLLRHPHPLLGGETYAQRLSEALVDRGLAVGGMAHIVEVGAGKGDLAAGVLGHLKSRFPKDSARYTIVDLSPTLRARQRETIEAAGFADRVSWQAGNAETDAFDGLALVDLLLCNEVVGDLTTVRLTREALETGEGLSTAKKAAVAEIRGFLEACGVSLMDAPPSFFVNLGALRFLKTVWRLLRPGGGAFISEYGDASRYPKAASHLDHIEFSVHFGHLKQAAEALGFEASVVDVQDLIGFDRRGQTMASTRSWFAALRAMLGSFGLSLDKVAWTDAMFIEHLGDVLPIAHIGDVRFEAADQRCMGLAPHEFKALLLRRPDH